MTPYEIEILLHCYAKSGPFSDSGIDDTARAFPDALSNLEMNKLIATSSNTSCGWVTTFRGNAHVMQLCHLRLPTQVWVGEDGEIIEL